MTGTTSTVTALLCAAIVGCRADLPALPPHRDAKFEVPAAEGRFRADSDEPTPLVRAIWADDPSQVERLLKAGANPNSRWGSGDRFPLYEAIVPVDLREQRRRDEIVRLLLAHGADPNQRFCPYESRVPIGNPPDGIPPCINSLAMTPLMAATRMDQWHVAYRLLDAGADPHALNWFKSTTLDYALGDFAYRLLLSAAFPGPDGEHRAAAAFLQRLSLHRSALLDHLEYRRLAAYYVDGESYGGLRLALKALGSLDAGTERRRVVLTNVLKGQRAIDMGVGEVAGLLVTAGADADIRECPATKLGERSDMKCTSQTGTTLLMLAASCGYRGLEQALTRLVNPSVVDWEGRNAEDYRRLKPLVRCGPFPLPPPVW